MLLEESKNRHNGKILTVALVHSRDVKRAPSHEIRHFCDSNAIPQQLGRERTPGSSFTLICNVLALLIALTIAPTVLLAGGGNVLPGPAKPRGYSLYDMAKATAFFNTGSHDLTFYPDTPFQILYIPPGTPANTSPVPFDVRPGTMLYVPILLIDDSPPIVGDFPNVNDRQAVLKYLYSPKELGTIYIKIVVDDMVNSLGSDYVVGVGNVKLGDGPGGTQEPRIGSYIVFAAFLTPLNKGTHTVKIQGYLTGAAVGGNFSFSDPPYIVIVR
jgi:hypothetical protein